MNNCRNCCCHSEALWNTDDFSVHPLLTEFSRKPKQKFTHSVVMGSEKSCTMIKRIDEKSRHRLAE